MKGFKDSTEEDWEWANKDPLVGLGFNVTDSYWKENYLFNTLSGSDGIYTIEENRENTELYKITWYSYKFYLYTWYHKDSIESFIKSGEWELTN